MRPAVHRRRSVRLRGYDYAHPGAYFITICTHHREPILGRILDQVVHLTPMGEIACSEWMRTQAIRPRITVDAFVIMPDHLHGILVITDADDMGGRGTPRRAPTTATPHAPPATPHAPLATPHARTASDMTPTERFGHPTSDSVPTIVRSFKATTTKQINRSRGTPGAPVWQRGYYEHVIRSDAELEQVRKYIRANPARLHRSSSR
jgi:REP element-mobilizing transposase RayT